MPPRTPIGSFASRPQLNNRLTTSWEDKECSSALAWSECHGALEDELSSLPGSYCLNHHFPRASLNAHLHSGRGRNCGCFHIMSVDMCRYLIERFHWTVKEQPGWIYLYGQERGIRCLDYAQTMDGPTSATPQRTVDSKTSDSASSSKKLWRSTRHVLATICHLIHRPQVSVSTPSGNPSQFDDVLAQPNNTCPPLPLHSTKK